MRSPRYAAAFVSLCVALLVPLAQDPSAGAAYDPTSAFSYPNSYGSAVAIWGGEAVVGAPVGSANGLAFIFARTKPGWRRQARLTDPAGYDFGDSVAISGSTAVIGSPGVSADAGDTYVFVRSGSAWHKQAVLVAPAGYSSGESFGAAVAISGSTMVIGAPFAKALRGEAYIYARSGSTWRLRASFADPGRVSGDSFGAAVAISAATVIIGSYGLHNYRGAAYIYTRSGSAWHRQAKIVGPKGGELGYSVAITGATAVIGAPYLRNDAGATFIYVRTGSAWRFQARLLDPAIRSAGSQFGWAVAVSMTRLGIRAVVGGPWTGLDFCGTAYDFARSGKTWREKARIANPGCRPNDTFGDTVALSGRNAVIGAPGKNVAYVQRIP